MCTYKDSARTSQRTHCTSIRKTNRLKQYGEIIVIYSENHRKHINMCCGRNASFVFLNISVRILTLRLLMSYIYGAPSKARNAKRRIYMDLRLATLKQSLSICCTMFQH